MTIVGIVTSERGGKNSTTLHVVGDFDAYQLNPDSGYICQGQTAESIYVGGHDCSGLEVGQEIEIYYGKAITTAKGTFQPVALIRVLSE